MKLQIQVDEETQRIQEVKFKTFGCGSAIASSSYLTELVRGMTLEDAGKVRNTEIARELCLPPVKCEFFFFFFFLCPFFFLWSFDLVKRRRKGREEGGWAVEGNDWGVGE